MAGLLAKIAKLMDDGYPKSVARRMITGELPMNEANRLARMADQTNPETLYHWTGADNITEFRPSDSGKYGPGVYLSPQKWYGEKYVSSGTPKRLEVLSKGNIAEIEDIGQVEQTVREIMREKGFEGHNFGNRYWSLIGDELKKKGFTGLRMDDEVLVFDPSNIRSPHAAFDPEYTGPNILGSRVAPTAGAGLLSLDQIADQNASIAVNNYMKQLGYDKDGPTSALYNYGDILPIKRHTQTGEYSPAMTGILEQVVRGLLETGESRKPGVSVKPQSLMDVLF